MTIKKQIKHTSFLVLAIFCFTAMTSGYLHVLENDDCHTLVQKKTDNDKHDHCTLCKVTHSTFLEFCGNTISHIDFESTQDSKLVSPFYNTLFVIISKRGPPSIS